MRMARPRIQSNVLLAPLTTIGVGGAARFFTRVRRPEQVIAAVEWAANAGEKLMVLGGGSNLLIGDDGFFGLVLQPAIPGLSIAERPGAVEVTAGAGVPWAWRVANGMASRVNGMHAAPAHSAFTRRLLAWGRARGATWIAHGHDHAPLLLERDGVTLVRPGATTGGHLRYALLDLVSGQASLHHERLG